MLVNLDRNHPVTSQSRTVATDGRALEEVTDRPLPPG